MKYTKIKFPLLSILFLSLLTSCTKDFLDPDAPGTIFETNYYKNENEAYSGLVATYDILSKHSGGFENMIIMFNAGSDDCTGGGAGPESKLPVNNFSNYTIDQINVPGSFWNNFYQGIFRANTLLEKLPNVPMDAFKKARFAAEAKMLRAYYHFELLRIFKNIPMFTKPSTPEDVATKLQENPNTVYAQIEQDLIEAIPNLPLTITNTTDEAGRFTQGAAKALLGKVYLYQGNKTLAAEQFADVNGVPGGTSIYGYKLLPSFANLWKSNNKFNTEAIIEISHSALSNAGYGNWGSGNDEGNAVTIMVGPRDYTRIGTTAPDFSFGFSFNPVTQNLYDFMKLDPRFNATIADIKALKTAGSINYTAGAEDTGYFLKKFMPLKSDIATGSGNVELNNKQNTYAIRLADTYLMEAEALNGTGARAQALLTAVRARVGLGPVPVSLNAIQNERRMELAGEGHRWFDLVRSGQAPTVLAGRGFVAGKNEIWPIPFKETQNTQIVQNPNYN